MQVRPSFKLIEPFLFLFLGQATGNAKKISEDVPPVDGGYGMFWNRVDVIASNQFENWIPIDSS